MPVSKNTINGSDSRPGHLMKSDGAVKPRRRLQLDFECCPNVVSRDSLASGLDDYFDKAGHRQSRSSSRTSQQAEQPDFYQHILTRCSG